MSLTKDSRLVQNLFRKRDLLAAGDERHKKIRTALLILGGGMRSVSGGGSAIALHRLGLGDVFDVTIGISAGAPVGAYFLAGYEQAVLGTSLYYEDLPSKFVAYLRKPIIDIDFLESVFREGRRKLDMGAVKSARSEFFVGLTRYEDGTGVLLDAKNACPDMIAAIKASTALPGLYNRPVRVNGQLFVDGGAGTTFPIREILAQFQPTDILVLANHPLKNGKLHSSSLKEKIWSPLLMRGVPPRLKRAIATRHERYQEGLAALVGLEDRGVGSGGRRLAHARRAQAQTGGPRLNPDGLRVFRAVRRKTQAPLDRSFFHTFDFRGK